MGTSLVACNLFDVSRLHINGSLALYYLQLRIMTGNCLFTLGPPPSARDACREVWSWGKDIPWWRASKS